MTAHRQAAVLHAFVFGMLVMLSGFQARAESRIDLEIKNLRDLPFGYRAWCEDKNLLFKSPTSARFRISKAALCAGKPDGYLVCMSDDGPALGTDGKRRSLCSELEAPGA